MNKDSLAPISADLAAIREALQRIAAAVLAHEPIDEARKTLELIMQGLRATVAICFYGALRARSGQGGAYSPPGVRCGQTLCNDAASHSFVWPGRERANICEPHLRKVLAIAEVLNLPLGGLDLQPVTEAAS